MYLIGGIASGYGGYLLNVCYQPGKDINYFLNRLDQVMVAPFANYWNETSLKAIILGIFVYVIGMVMYVTSRKNYIPERMSLNTLESSVKPTSPSFSLVSVFLNCLIAK